MAAKTGRDFPGFENEWAQGVCGRSVGLERSGCHELPKWIQQDSFPGQQTMFLKPTQKVNKSIHPWEQNQTRVDQGQKKEREDHVKIGGGEML